MFTEDQKSLLKSAKENLMQFGNRDGLKVVTTPDEAVKQAKETENRQMEGQTSLQKDDVFTVPADDAEFNDCLIARKFNKSQNGLSIGLLVVVKRGTKEVVVQVYSTAFTRGQRLIGAMVSQRRVSLILKVSQLSTFATLPATCIRLSLP